MHGDWKILSADQAYYEVVYLDKISYPGGSVHFRYASGRKDYSPEVRLTAISINDASGKEMSCWNLEHAYFTANAAGTDVPELAELNRRLSNLDYYNSSWNNSLYTEDWNKKRLKLTAVRHTGEGIESPEVYTFDYQEEQLPTKLSASRDHWGYYNGAPNQSLQPGFYQNTNQQIGPEKVEYQGGKADREPNGSYNQAFLLRQMTYPTGGSAKFTYGANLYRTDDFENDACKRDFMYAPRQLRLYASQEQGGNNIPFLSQSFTVSTSGRALPLDFRMVIDHGLYNKYAGDPELEISVRRNLNDESPLWSYTYNSVTRYQQDPVHFYTIRKEVLSGGDTLRTVEYIYPFDKDADVVMAKMTAQNRISDPVEIKEYTDSCLWHTMKEYALDGDIPRLSALKTHTAAGPAWESRVVYHKYDRYGNPLFVSTGGHHTVYLWGYEGQYPVAEICGATYDEVADALGCSPESLSVSSSPDMSLVDGLRNALPHCSVFTYTYQPHVGMLTQTSPSGQTVYYTYDSFGRLKEQYRMEGGEKQIIESYEYHYINR